MLRFHPFENYLVQAQEIFRWIVSTHSTQGIQYAIASTIEPLYFSICLDVQVGITLHSYLFHDNKRIELSSGLSNSVFRLAEMKELDDIVRFYQSGS